MARRSIRSSPVRYALVGLGHIAQVAVLPAFRRAGAHAQLTALVSGDPRKRQKLARDHRIERTYSYDEYEACLAGVEAVYIALPNSMHAEYAIRAARAGVHVLCEKPMAVTVDDCRAMIDACRAHDVKLMIAYRLHFDAVTLAVSELVRRGRIGVPRLFNASFSITVRDGNVRTKRNLGGGSVYDIGVYCINAARHLFRAEPIEVLATSAKSGARRFEEIDESTGAVMRFDGGGIAAFVTSLNAAGVGSYRIVGTKGDIFVNPAYAYSRPLAYELTVDGKTTRTRGVWRDQFAAQLSHFSDCIRRNRPPGPSGEDGLQDVRIAQAIYESAETGRAVTL